MAADLTLLAANLNEKFPDKVVGITSQLGELTMVVRAADLLFILLRLRDDPSFHFEQLIDLCGVDYSAYGDGIWDGARFAVVSHLLSVSLNWRLRVRTFATDDEMPIVPSLIDVWTSSNWYEREAFDLFGILFDGHTEISFSELL